MTQSPTQAAAPPSQSSPSQSSPSQDTRAGFFYALSAYLLWGFLPFYMKALAHVPPPEVIVHRVLWSLPIALGVVAWAGRWPALVLVLKTPPKLVLAMACSGLISVNWGLYVWAIGSGHTLEAALGYYINPLFSIFLGAVLLREKLNGRQKGAIALAAAAVAVLTLETGRLPLVALGLTLTWGLYAYLKRRMPIGPNEGFALEVLILSPFALAYAVYLSATGQAVFLTEVPTTVLLLSAGLVTAIPLMLYANGAKGLSLSTIGIMQYISPTMILAIATLAFGEHLGTAQMIAFPMIWGALALYSSGLWRR
ncbi:EamA family transporter RarD [Stagnihabitans tardus]|uniref:EamA family transporter RarD n=1 Tax=Stagnihabitans tardus TaxID=2699202 RepID=A0AAE5BXD2_9RHOB|nr:EamA family transporter RarD [Stagnihabitans tardus]NBZ89869.1 EamA family transporter RarD [Stagnihabitans tardus]